MFAEDDPHLAGALYHTATDEITKMGGRAGRLLEDAEPDALAYLAFPRAHRRKLRTNDVQEGANREARRRGKVARVFPSEASPMLYLSITFCNKYPSEMSAAGC